MNQLTSRHDFGIVMSPVSPSCATVWVLAPPENVHCRRKSERHSHTNTEKLSNKSSPVTRVYKSDTKYFSDKISEQPETWERKL